MMQTAHHYGVIRLFCFYTTVVVVVLTPTEKLATGAAGALTVAMGMRYVKTVKMMPAGLLAGLGFTSLGYHAIKVSQTKTLFVNGDSLRPQSFPHDCFW